MVFANVTRRLKASSKLLELSLQEGLSNVEKSTYYRSATILLCTSVEALVFELVRKNTPAPNHIFYEYSELIQLHKIKAGALSTPSDIFCCKMVKKQMGISNIGADFGKYLVFLKNKNIITQQKYKSLEWIRKERNKVHVQGIVGRDIGYTKAKVNRVADEVTYLINKLT